MDPWRSTWNLHNLGEIELEIDFLLETNGWKESIDEFAYTLGNQSPENGGRNLEAWWNPNWIEDPWREFGEETPERICEFEWMRGIELSLEE